MIPEIKRILYATDLSKNSSYAFLYAIDMAQKRDAKIVILHAIEPISPRILSHLEDTGDLKNLELLQKRKREDEIELMKNRIQEFCKRVETQIGPCIEFISKILVPIGHPTEEILNTAGREGCDVIVLGTHGKGFLAHTFLGSVSSSVLHRTSKPIFIIPLPTEKATIDLGEI